ncbi:hypothetical protein ALC57_06546 [Trachymyrmex cornetzi]|uniref:Chromo domain-containing protein n=1 Tax=Trachymyrmex cornetzi TaxID=471704 RepID=A0A151J8S9_9HYME|nr:hypothetical protein ALC57_06546 [Trachymyrmex cornetzi]
MSGETAREIHRHGHLLPNTIRCIICGPSNCDKTNALISLIESPHGVCFENVYVYSKSLFQPKYRYLEKLLKSISSIDYYAFFNNRDVIRPKETLPNSIFVFDDMACDNQYIIREYFSMGRHRYKHRISTQIAPQRLPLKKQAKNRSNIIYSTPIESQQQQQQQVSPFELEDEEVFRKSTPQGRNRLYSQLGPLGQIYVNTLLTYLLKDYQGKPITGGFYEYELRVSNPDVYLVEKILRKRGNKVNVKWLGMDSSYNSWIDKTDLL